MLINYGSCVVCFILNNSPTMIGDWEYTRTPNESTVTLNKYLGNDTNVVVPTQIHIDEVMTELDCGSIDGNIISTEDAGSISDSNLSKLKDAGNIS